MKFFYISLLLAAMLSMIACSNELEKDKAEVAGLLISKNDAYTLAKEHLKNKPLTEIDIYRTVDMLPAHTKIISVGNEDIISPDCDSWLFFVDEMPLIANWEHPCKYIFVNAIGKVYVYERTMFPTKPSMEQMELLNKADVWNEYEGKPIVHDIPKNYSRSTSSEHLYAVIISGGGDKFNNHIRYWNDCSFIYKTLVNQYGYNPANIYVLMSDGTNPGIDTSSGTSSNVDLDDDGIADIDYAATKSNVINVFNQLADKLTEEDYLFVYTIDHGGLDSSRNESYLVLWNGMYIYANEFSELVKSVNTQATNIVMGQCNSGGFIDYFKNSPNICISTACAKNEYSFAMTGGLYDEYVYYWTNSHVNLVGDNDRNTFVSASESHVYSVSRDSRNETPQHYAGTDCLAEKLALSGKIKYSYGNLIDGYCVINSVQKEFYLVDSKPHEPEFGVHPGDKINIYLTSPDIGVYSFSWSVVEGGNLCFFNKSSKMAHLEVYSSASLGTRIRIKVEADIPASDYYICQYLNFYVY
jgi:hypothetical protein